MNQNEAKELHNLLFSFVVLFHEKFLTKFRGYYDAYPWLKKNHIKIIYVLSQQDYLTSTEIGKKLDIEKGSLTTLIDSLEEKNLVVRRKDLNDRRKTLISLSPQGREMIRQMLAYHTKKTNDILSDFQREEIQDFVQQLKSAVEFMKKM